MMSRPSSRTQRTYGESFSVANFFAKSSETIASLATCILHRAVFDLMVLPISGVSSLVRRRRLLLFGRHPPIHADGIRPDQEDARVYGGQQATERQRGHRTDGSCHRTNHSVAHRRTTARRHLI